MDEEKTQSQPSEATQNNGNGSQPEVPEVVKQAIAQNERMEKNIAAMSAENDRQENLEAVRRISGRSEAGSQPPADETSDEKWAREAKERYAGTGNDPTVDDSETTYG